MKNDICYKGLNLFYEATGAIVKSPSSSESSLCPFLSRIQALYSSILHAYNIELKKDERLYFQRETNNRHDKNAIAVRTYNGEIVGHLTKEIAAQLAPFLQFDTCVFGTVSSTYYGGFNTKMLVEQIIENKRHSIFK